jgi:alpha-L-glutamate ligase-like protein
MNLFKHVRRLSQVGVLGLNERNCHYISALNPRRLYPLVDDKLRTKELALQAGMAVPELYGTVHTDHDANQLEDLLEGRDNFVIKPATGSGGDGILVVAERKRHDRFRLISGQIIRLGELKHHVSNILSGQYSLGGNADTAIIEYCVRFDPLFEPISYLGVPDIRIIVYRGYPAMAMVRLPTRQSQGKANLHQGAVGAGIDMASGRTTTAVLGNESVEEHPDTGAAIAGVQIPDWAGIVELAARCSDVVGLGYLGVDVVLDRDQGALILELNARPGLNIQIANRLGLKNSLHRIDTAADEARDFRQRAALSLTLDQSLAKPMESRE